MSWADDYFKLLEEEKKKKKKEEEKNETYADNEFAEIVRLAARGVLTPTTTTNRKERVSAPSASEFLNSYTEQKARESLEEHAGNQTRAWFDEGAFRDGYDFGDIFKTVTASGLDAKTSIMSGILGIGETVVDAGAYLAGGAAGLFGGDKFKNKMQDFIAKDLYDERAVAKKIVRGSSIASLWTEERDSILGERSDDLLQSGGQLVGTMALQSVGVPWFVTSGVTSFGGEVENALNQGASYGEAGLSGMISTGAELISEKLFGGSGLGEKGIINLDGLTKGISSKLVKALVDHGVDMTAEGFEEVFSQVASNLGSALYREENLKDILLSEEAFDGYLESFLGGMVLSGAANTSKLNRSIKDGRDYRTGMTANEQKVFDKVYEDAIKEAEQDGKKLTSTEKAEIYDDVLEQMEKGYISTDTIEEVLGDRTEYDALSKEAEEFDKLYNTAGAELSEAQRDRLAELKAKNTEKLYKDALQESKSKYSQSVLELVKNDRLSESYAERSRRGQTFEADISRYDAKQQQTIQKAIDSGILNNTRRTHEFVDMVAKITADKGVLFDFTNNEKLKNSGFAVDGKFVNGFVTKDGVTLNVNSAKSLNSIVGHEITHVLEGTDVYTELQKAITEYAKTKGDYQGRYDALSKLYQNIEGANTDNELTADLVGDYLFTDTDFINNLSTQNRNVFQKIWDEVKYLYNVATAGSKEKRELAKVQRAFEKAYREAGNAAKDTKYSLNANAKTELHRALYDVKYRSEVLLRDESPAIMLAQKGVKNLPMAMNASHIRENVFTEVEATKLGLKVDEHTHYHGLGEDFFLKVIDGLDNVKVAYRGTKNAKDPSRRENYFLLVSEFKDQGGNTVNVPVYIDEHAQVNRVFIDVNKISTVFGRDAFQDYINRQIQNGDLVRIKNRGTKTSERDALIAPGYGNDTSSKVNISQEDPNVKYSLSDSEGNELTANGEPAGDVDIRYSLTEYTPEEKKAHNKAVLDHFGRTYKWAEAGYVLLDGSKLDLSGKHEGAPGGYRTVDHRDIVDALGSDYGDDTYSGSLVQFMSEGNIRISPESNGINLSVKPNKAQEMALSDFISRARGEVLLDIDGLDGYTVVSVEYPRGTHANKVLNDIREWFDNGKQPEVSNLSQFRYSFSEEGQKHKRYRGNVYGKDIALETAPTKETVSKMENVAPVAEENTVTDLFPYEQTPGVDELMAEADGLAPVAENAATTEFKVMDAPVAEKYEAIRPMPAEKSTEPKTVRTDNKGKERKWVGTSTGSEAVDGKVTPDDIPDEVRYYQPIPNKKTLGNANSKLGNMGYDKALAYFNSQLYSNKVSLDDIALGERLIQEAVKKGDTKTAGELIQNVAILGTELGQKVQALSIIKRLTPEGQLKMLQKTVERGKTKGDKAFEGVEITQDMIDYILKTYGKDGSYDPAELTRRVEDVKQQIADQMKVTAMDKINAWRYLSMLGNPKTHIRNIVSNVAMFGTRKVKDAVARTIEDIAPVKERAKTWKRATEAVKDFAKLTTDELYASNTDNKYNEGDSIKAKRQIFKTNALEKMSNFNSDALTAEDTFFSKPAYREALSEFLTANGIKTEADIKKNGELVEKAKQYAMKQAKEATFQQDSYLANKISEIERKNPLYNIAVGSVLPFKKTPINIAKAGLSYSPLGIARNIYDMVQVKKGNMDASEAIDHVAQTLTGTSLTLVGYMLAQAGILNGAGDDDKEDDYDYQLGKQGYSITIGGDTFSLSWLSPVAMPLFVGANAYEQLVEGKEWNADVVVETLAQTLDPLSEMSFLSSLDSVLSSYDSGIEKFVGIFETAGQNYITQFVPTLSSQIAATFDDTKRSTKVAADSDFKFGDRVMNQIKYKIPGLRNTLEPSTDIWGNEVKQTENGGLRAAESFLAPWSKREDITSAVDEEIKSLYSQVGDGSVIPAIPSNTINYDGVKYEMSAKEHTAYKQVYGQIAYDTLEDLFATETYQNADAETRRDMVKMVYDYARDEAKLSFFDGRDVDFTNATEDEKGVYRENDIIGAIKADLPVDEYRFSEEYPEKYKFFTESGIGYDAYAAADEEGKRAYSWAYENPGKYTMSKAVADDFLTFYQYRGELFDIEGEKDENGRTISGTKKEAVIEYINDMDLDYGQKIILFRSMYDSKADHEAYNADIVEYLNSRDDISYEEMVTILEELGMKVNGNNVTWD